MLVTPRLAALDDVEVEVPVFPVRHWLLPRGVRREAEDECRTTAEAVSPGTQELQLWDREDENDRGEACADSTSALFTAQCTTWL
jgi:hypothetical protein